VNRLIEALIDQYLFDVSIMSNFYVLVFVFPALFYMMFMLVKWSVLTIPLWVPVAAVAKLFVRED
jgi:hypothetical protein